MTSHSPIGIDYTLAMAAGIGSEHGITDGEWSRVEKNWNVAYQGVLQRAGQKDLAFWTLLDATDHLAAVHNVAQRLSPSLTNVVVLGIGGSSLGPRSVVQALQKPLELTAHRSQNEKSVYFPDNCDPWFFSQLLQALRPEATLFLVISKSGTTVETAAQWLIAHEWLKTRLGESAWRNHVVMITDPSDGNLRVVAEQEPLLSLPIPPEIGGRFSVLSAVGLLPALLAGSDIDALWQGALAMRQACSNARAKDNPAGILAVLSVVHHLEKGCVIDVLMPYSDALRSFGSWWVQLWSESLGKQNNRAGQIVESGPTPLCAVGATDQHAQMQLFMQGPRNKLITFIHVASHSHDWTIPENAGDFSYLSGQKLSTLLSAECRATRHALAQMARASVLLEVPRLDAFHLGALYFLYEATTAFAAELYDVNAFDQPGVELAKKLTMGLMGKPGYEHQRSQIVDAQFNTPSSYRIPANTPKE